MTGPTTPNEVTAVLRRHAGEDIVTLMRRVGLNPDTDFAGGDWRHCDFSRLVLRDMDFRNSRLHLANFAGASVRGADFTGADDVVSARLHLATDWPDAILTGQQRAALTRRSGSPAPTPDDQDEWLPGYFVHMIHDAPTYAAARELWNAMRARYPDNGQGCTALIKKAPNIDAAMIDFETHVDDGGPVDIGLLTAVLGKVRDWASAQWVIAQVRDRQLQRDKYYFNLLITKADTMAQGFALVDEMVAIGIEVSEYTLFALFDVSDSVSDAVDAMARARKEGVEIFTWEVIEDFVPKTPMPDITMHNVTKWREEGARPADVVRKIIDRCVGNARGARQKLDLG